MIVIAQFVITFFLFAACGAFAESIAGNQVQVFAIGYGCCLATIALNYLVQKIME